MSLKYQPQRHLIKQPSTTTFLEPNPEWIHPPVRPGNAVLADFFPPGYIRGRAYVLQSRINKTQVVHHFTDRTSAEIILHVVDQRIFDVFAEFARDVEVHEKTCQQQAKYLSPSAKNLPRNQSHWDDYDSHSESDCDSDEQEAIATQKKFEFQPWRPSHRWVYNELLEALEHNEPQQTWFQSSVGVEAVGRELCTLLNNCSFPKSRDICQLVVGYVLSNYLEQARRGVLSWDTLECLLCFKPSVSSQLCTVYRRVCYLSRSRREAHYFHGGNYACPSTLAVDP